MTMTLAKSCLMMGLAVHMLEGQSIRVVDSVIKGIRLYDAHSPEFRQAISLAPRDVTAAADRLLQRSILIENQTGRPIRGVTVRFDGINRKGRPAYRIESFRDLDQRIAPFFRTSSRIIISMHRTVSNAFLSGKFGELSPVKQQELLEVQLFDSFQGLTASIDSVLYSDGQFEGPDVSKHYDLLTATKAARLLLITEADKFLSKGDTNSLRAFLLSRAKQTGSAHPEDPVVSRDIERVEASRLLHILDRSGSTGAMDTVRIGRSELMNTLIWKGKEN